MTTNAGDSIEGAALAARNRVGLLGGEPVKNERGSAALAQAALFDEALLGALKARFGEIRSAAR